MYLIKRLSITVLLFPFLVLICNESYGQQTPLNPLSYRIFSPFIFNPAIAGSKDFLSFDFLSSWYGKYRSQIISSNTRLTKASQGYISSPDAFEFTNLGVGGAIFNDMIGNHRNTGISGTVSYHFPLGDQQLSFLSVGASAKGIYNFFSGDQDLGLPEKNRFFPNIDAGVYFYGQAFFAGISATNLLGPPEDTLGTGIPVSRQYFLYTGYKIILSRSLDIVLEPSIILNSGESSSPSPEIKDIIEPVVKIYFQDFCIGTYINDFEKIPFFLQYRYPRFYISAYFQIPRDTPFYKENLLVEFALGLNLSGHKIKFAGAGHW